MLDCNMSNLSIRLPDELEQRLIQEAETTRRKRSEIIREAVDEYLNRRERDRFMQALVREVGANYAAEIELAEEGLSGDNEALALEEPVKSKPRAARKRSKK